MAVKNLQDKKIAIVIAFREFRDIEYFIPRNILASAGAKITTVSSEKGTAIGADGGEVQVNLTTSDLKVEGFDAVVFIGGPGMAKKLDDEGFQRVARETIEKDKVLGAICIAPALLAKAGVLTGKRATVWSDNMNKSAVKILKEAGAKYEEKEVVVDDKIITSPGPQAAKQFGEALVEVLTAK